MDIKELVIGDWLYDCHDYYNRGMEKKPTQLDREGLIDLLCSCTSHDDLDLGCMSQPIPLTEDILKANGFEPILCWYVCPKRNLFGEDVYVAISKDGTSFSSIEEDICISTPFVHKLQHALRLCGLDELADNFKVE